MPEKKKTEYNYLYKKQYRDIYECGLCDHMEMDEAKMIAHLMTCHSATEQKIVEACY